MGRLHQDNGGVIGAQAFSLTTTQSGHAGAMSGGTAWFSSGYFGVDPTPEYILAPGTYTTLRYRRTQASSYGWWALFCTRSTNTYTVTFGARINTPDGTAGEVIDLQISQAAQIVGSPTVSGSNTYLCWLSHAPGAQSGPSNIHFWDAQLASYIQTSTVPAVGVAYTVTNLDSGGNPQFQAIFELRQSSGIFQLGSQKLPYQP